MARVYALLQPDGSLLVARQKGDGWTILSGLQGLEARGRNLTVFLDGLDVLGLGANIPARNEAQARRAAPYAVEDDIAEAAETSHVALALPDKTEATPIRQVNVIAAERLGEISQHLTERGLSDAAIVAAHSVLPQRDLLVEGPGLILGRLGERSFAIDAALGPDVLVGLIEGHSDVAIHGESLAQALRRDATGPGVNTPQAFLTQLATWAEAGDGGINLRQGTFEARRQVDLEGVGHWKFAGGLAALAALGWFGSVMLETSAMNTRSDKLRELSAEFAQVGWPETNGDVQQVLAMMGNRVSGTGQSFPSVLNASAILYAAMAQVEGSELRSLRYDRLRRQMTATVAFESFADVDRLTAIVNDQGLRARSGDARQSGARVIGDLTLEGAP